MIVDDIGNDMTLIYDMTLTTLLPTVKYAVRLRRLCTPGIIQLRSRGGEGGRLV